MMVLKKLRKNLAVASKQSLDGSKVQDFLLVITTLGFRPTSIKPHVFSHIVSINFLMIGTVEPPTVSCLVSFSFDQLGVGRFGWKKNLGIGI